MKAAQECLRKPIDIWVELTIDLSLKPFGYLKFMLVRNLVAVNCCQDISGVVGRVVVQQIKLRQTIVNPELN